MHSSINEESGHSGIGPVRLPTFEEMVNVPPPEVTEQVEEDEAASLLETEIQRTERLCSNMRKEAQLEADRLIEETRRECISIRDKTRRETIDEVRAEAEAASRGAKESILKAVTSLQSAQDSLYDDLEPYFLDIALHISENILQYELDRDDTAYLSIIRNALSIYRSDGRARTLFLPPKAYNMLVGENEDGPLMAQLQNVNIDVVMDKSIADGDCLVESSVGGIRAGVVTQLSRMRYAASPEENS